MMAGVRQVTLGTQQLDFPSKQLQQLDDDNDCLGDQSKLKARIHDKGWVITADVQLLMKRM